MKAKVKGELGKALEVLLCLNICHINVEIK